MSEQPERTAGDGLRERVIAALRSVHDPELPVNIYDLGLIYDLGIGDGGAVSIRMTLTAPNCPVADQIPRDVERAVRGVEGVSEADVTLVWEPAWSADMMSDAAELELSAMGIDLRRGGSPAGSRMTGLTVGRRPRGEGEDQGRAGS